MPQSLSQISPKAQPAPMPKSPDFDTESLRLVDTKAYLEATIATVFEKRIRSNTEMKEAYLHLDPSDSSSSYATIMFNAQLLDNLEQHFDQLLNARKKPYFARIDVKNPKKPDVQALYLGKISLFDETMPYPMVVDWRAPVASLYYDGRLGPSTYRVEADELEVDLSLKRQYTIEDAELIAYMDVDISTSDAFLQATLGQHAGEKLKDIVSTIQAEQNVIIRADIHKPLIVQGVAGSGKTTIALHRIAYLMYTYAKSFLPEDFIIVAPNTLFLDYISSVLPELGADKVKQVTYTDLMLGWLGKRYGVTGTHEKLNRLVSHTENPKDLATLTQVAAFKNGMGMKNLLDRYITYIEGRLLPEQDLNLDNLLVLNQESIANLYFGNYAYLPLYQRIDALRRYMAQSVKATSLDAIETIQNRVSSRIQNILFKETPGDERRAKVVSLMDRREARVLEIKQAAKTTVAQYIKKVPKDDAMGYYKTLMSNPELIEQLMTPELEDMTLVDMTDDLEGQKIIKERRQLIAALVSTHNALVTSKKIELEDLAPLVYLKAQLFGVEDSQMKYAVIDEAQDFGVFQFYVLKQLFNTERFTILGDMAQGIHMYRAIDNWDLLQEHVFTTPATYLTLEQSYRTTVEIMEKANEVLAQSMTPDLIMAKPVVRHGDTPQVYYHETPEALIPGMLKTLKMLSDGGYTTVAIITKSSQEAKWMHKKLTALGLVDLMLIDENSQHFNHRLVVVPSYLAKGLEFDAVLVTTIHETYAIDPLDAKLLYVAMTRAMHHLSLHVVEGTMPYFSEVQN